MRIDAAVVLVMTVSSAGASAPMPRSLTFRDRVAAQEAIERVYYRHQIGAAKAFNQAVPRALIETKVRTYLKETSALARYWHTPVTGTMLEGELLRMERGSRMPERLNELFEALGNDSGVILECLVRPALVDRLTRNFFDYDQTIHAEARAEAETVRTELASGLEVDRGDSRRVPIDVMRGEADGAPPDRRLAPDAFDRLSDGLPRNSGDVGPVVERPDRYTVSVLYARTQNHIRAAVYTVHKKTLPGWWASVEASLSLSSGLVSPKLSGVDRVSIPTNPAACAVDDTWEPTLDDAPEWRTRHSAVWTGNEMIVWGGLKPFFALSHPGLRYDPATDTWKETSPVDAPAVGDPGQRAVWAGGRLVVLGHGSGVYDPASDSWSGVSDVNRAYVGDEDAVVAVGDSVIVWGGLGQAVGKRYDWAADRWTTISTANAPAARSGHAAVSTGTQLIVWGGVDDAGQALGTGGVYDLASDKWRSMNAVGAPVARAGHAAAWAGHRLIVWGGAGDDGLLRSDGGRYDPVANAWSSLSIGGAPSPRTAYSVASSGERLLVWGGSDSSGSNLATGARYDPAADTWTEISLVNAPSSRREQSAVWSGDRMIVWGGTTGGDHVLNTGGRYDPRTDTWTPTSVGSTPVGRSIHTAVWTGARMIVWGGYDLVSSPNALDSGSRYDPATDTWSPTTSSGAPLARYAHTAVWTGSVMVVWGGYAGYPTGNTNTGSRYDPIADTWSPTANSGAPAGCYGHSAIWTGSSMLVWGGFDGSSVKVATGGRYDPIQDAWVAISRVGAPSARALHAAVWTGRRMVIWGGGDFASSVNTGGRYDPRTDRWGSTSLRNAPRARTAATAVWTGNRMIVWGGRAGGGQAVDTGGRYDPVKDHWTTTSTTEAPVRRFEHSAVWTGREMVVWGGVVNFDLLDNSGGRYDPASDSWTPTSAVNVPSGRHQHSAVWSGTAMIVFGGSGNEGGRESFSSGGIYRTQGAGEGDGLGSGSCFLLGL